MTTKSPSVRSQKYITNLMSGKSAYRSAIDAGYSPATAKNARKNVENQGVSETLFEAMQQVGISIDLLAEKLSEGLAAVRYIMTEKGLQPVPDYSTRQRYLQLAVSLAVPLQEQREQVVNVINYADVQGMSDEELDGRINQIISEQLMTNRGE